MGAVFFIGALLLAAGSAVGQPPALTPTPMPAPAVEATPRNSSGIVAPAPVSRPASAGSSSSSGIVAPAPISRPASTGSSRSMGY